MKLISWKQTGRKIQKKKKIKNLFAVILGAERDIKTNQDWQFMKGLM